MTYELICEAVEKLKKKYCESDLRKLCGQMGIIIIPQAMGREENAIKGFFLEKNRIKTITVNSDLPTIIQNIIIAHEIGHAVLHKNKGVHAFHEFSLFDSSSMMEKDANLFAAELLLEDEDVLEMMNSDTMFFAAAAALNVPMELLDFKFRIMKWKGYMMMQAPIEFRSNFLKNIEIPENLTE